MFEVDTISRQAIGFDRLFDVMNSIRGTDTNYPPYDIIKQDEETFIIEFALSGFKKDDLNIVVKENHLHHWSYNKEHWKDCIELSEKEHNLAHRYMIYDQERMMYRDLDGILLDTKEAHLEYLSLFINKD